MNKQTRVKDKIVSEKDACYEETERSGGGGLLGQSHLGRVVTQAATQHQTHTPEEDRSPTWLLFVPQRGCRVMERGEKRSDLRGSLGGALSWRRRPCGNVLIPKLRVLGISDGQTGRNGEAQGQRTRERCMIVSLQNKTTQPTARFFSESLERGLHPLYWFESFCYAKNFLCASWSFILQSMGSGGWSL